MNTKQGFSENKFMLPNSIIFKIVQATLNKCFNKKDFIQITCHYIWVLYNIELTTTFPPIT